MTIINLPIFGKVDYLNIADDYHVINSEFEFHNKIIVLDINIEKNEAIDESNFETIKIILNKLEEYNKDAINIITENQNRSDGSEHAHLYFQHLNDDCGINSRDALNQIYLRRIGFYPQQIDTYAVLDYSIDPEIVGNQLLALYFSIDSTYSYLAWES